MKQIGLFEAFERERAARMEERANAENDARLALKMTLLGRQPGAASGPRDVLAALDQQSPRPDPPSGGS